MFPERGERGKRGEKMMKETRIAGSGVAGRVSIRVEVRGTLAIWASIS